MRVLILNYEYPPLGGGAGVITSHIAEGLARLENEVTVLTTWFAGESRMTETMHGKLRIIRLDSRRKFTYRSNVWEMYSWIRESKRFLITHLQDHKYDIVFANFALPGGEVAGFLRKRYGVPFVIISHGHDIPWFFPRQMFIYHLLAYFRIRSICAASSALFVQSQAMLKNARRFLGERGSGKIHLIPNGADYRAFFSDGTLRSAHFRILFSGRLVRQKGPFIFLDALIKLQKRGIPFETVIAGDGPLKKGMEAVVRRNRLSDSVVFKGWMEKAAIISEYRAAHIMVAPSLDEGMSISLMEALASGLYVFTTPVSCNAKLVREGLNGEIFPAADSGALADQLARYYYNKFPSYQVPEDSVRAFHHEYAWDHIVEEYHEILAGICGEKRSDQHAS